MPERENTADRILESLRNNKFLAVIVVLALIVIGVGTLTESLDKIINFTQKYLSPRSEKQDPARTPVDTFEVASDPHQSKPVARTQEAPLQRSSKQQNFTGQQASETKSELSPKQPLVRQEPSLGPDLEPTGTRIESASAVEKAAVQKSFRPDIAPNKLEVELKRVDPTSSPSPEVRVPVRAEVRAIAIALSGQTLSAREASLASARRSLPANLTGQEIAVLLGSETLSTRTALLRVLVQHTLNGSISPDAVPVILADEDMSSREKMTEILAPYIAAPIRTEVAVKILGPATDCTRTRCLKHIASLIQRPITAQDVTALLRTIMEHADRRLLVTSLASS